LYYGHEIENRGVATDQKNRVAGFDSILAKAIPKNIAIILFLVLSYAYKSVILMAICCIIFQKIGKKQGINSMVSVLYRCIWILFLIQI
jgi:hypothetical protein